MSEFKYKLGADRVLIIPDIADEKTETGLYRAPTSQTVVKTATVIDIGNGITENGKVEMWVKKGDKVFIEPFGWEPFEGYLLGRQTSIKCTYTEQ